MKAAPVVKTDSCTHQEVRPGDLVFRKETQAGNRALYTVYQPVEKVAAVHNASKIFRQAEPQLTDSTLLENRFLAVSCG